LILARPIAKYVVEPVGYEPTASWVQKYLRQRNKETTLFGEGEGERDNRVVYGSFLVNC